MFLLGVEGWNISHGEFRQYHGAAAGPPMPEGRLIILRLDVTGSGTPGDFLVYFAPHPRGPLPADRRCHGEHGLRAFLEEAEIRPDMIDTAILGLRTATEYEILNVYLTPERLAQLGLRLK
jgi:hypothetical protein